MGGTTAKLAVAIDGEPAMVSQFELHKIGNATGSGIPMNVRSLDLAENGSGGGSIARATLGSIAVGPDSAGSAPGPACFGNGGKDPTVTDANVVLGRLEPSRFLGGGMRLDVEAARAAVARAVGEPLGLAPEAAAAGIIDVAVSHLAGAIRVSLFEKGLDPKDFALLSFGGAGGLHAAAVAAALEIPRVVYPRDAGTLSAWGMHFCDIAHRFAGTRLTRADADAPAALAALLARLSGEALAALEADGIPPGERRFELGLDMRYPGQAYELTVPVASGQPDVARLVEAFGREHERTYGHQSPHDPVDLVNIRVVARVAAENGAAPRLAAATPLPAQDQRRRVYFGAEGWHELPVLSRASLAGQQRAGPLIVEEYDATCVVPPGWSAGLDGAGNIHLAREATS
jgi:N-methylhydantoinase A